MFEFTTEIEVSRTGNNSVSSAGGKAKIKWTLDIEAREYGIKGFMVIVPDQKITAELTRYDEETDEEIEFTEEIELKNVKVYPRGDMELSSFLRSGFAPTELEIYLSRYEVIFK